MRDIKIFTGTAWESIVGPPGKDGVDGKDGSGVTIKGTATTYPPDASPTVGDMWLTGDPVPAGAPAGTQPGDGLVWTGTDWNNVGGIRGPKGADGVDGADGAPGKDGVDGAPGTLTLFTQDAPPANNDNGNLYVSYGDPTGEYGPDGNGEIYEVDTAIVCINGTWFRIKDPAQEPTGITAIVVTNEAGTQGPMPVNSLHLIGYKDEGKTTPNGDPLYTGGSAWLAQNGTHFIDLAGAKGDTGAPGADGKDGADGRSVAVTVSATQPATAAVGDVWIEPT